MAQSTTEAQVLSTAKSMNISTQQQALDALKSRGISESQERQMARMRGVDFDSFLSNYFTTAPNATNTAITTGTILPSTINATNNVVDALNVTSTPIITGVSQENTLSSITKAEADKYFGYEIFLNNPFAQ